MRLNEFEQKLNREFLFYHRDNPNLATESQQQGKSSKNIGNEMYSRLNHLSSKLTEIPVVLIDKRTDKSKYSFKNKNSILNNQSFGVKSSPSYLLNLMRSISDRSKTSSKIRINYFNNNHANNKKNFKLENLNTDTSNSVDSLAKRNKYSFQIKNQNSESNTLYDISNNSNIRIPLTNRLSSDKSSFHLDLTQQKTINSIKTDHFYKSNEKLLGRVRHMDDDGKKLNPYLDKHIFDEFLKSKKNLISANDSNLGNINSKASLRASNNNNDLNTEAVELLFNVSKNVLFLLVLLLIIWPATILFKLFWLISKYSSCLFPNLEDFCEFFDKWHKNFLDFDDKLLDQITFLN